MKKTLLTIALISLTSLSFAAGQQYKGLAPSGQMVKIPSPNNETLPSPYPVYVHGNAVINHPVPGFKKKLVPTNNKYKKNPGCYVVCFSHGLGVYPVGGGISVVGQIRVPGVYDQDRTCVPQGYKGKDLTASSHFRHLCDKNFQVCADTKEGCWADGDTGGWFGMQRMGSQKNLTIKQSKQKQ